MDKAQLLALQRLSKLPLRDVRVRDEALFRRLQERLGARGKAFVRAVPGLSPVLREHLAALELPVADVPAREAKPFILRSLESQRVPPEALREASRLLDELERAGVLAEHADLGLAVEHNPLVQQELQQA
ncbi:MAG TPA: hypothetical protein VFX28_06360, partial [Methylomirabilota bacterium]|nr:hypothetical protein [Methylomirabilota bacterium]